MRQTCVHLICQATNKSGSPSFPSILPLPLLTPTANSQTQSSPQRHCNTTDQTRTRPRPLPHGTRTWERHSPFLIRDPFFCDPQTSSCAPRPATSDRRLDNSHAPAAYHNQFYSSTARLDPQISYRLDTLINLEARSRHRGQRLTANPSPTAESTPSPPSLFHRDGLLCRSHHLDPNRYDLIRPTTSHTLSRDCFSSRPYPTIYTIT